MSSAQSLRAPSPEMLAAVQAIRIVSLPCEVQTGDDVYRFVHDFLGFDPSSVNIVPMQTEQGVRYRSAFVDINGLVADNVSRPMSQSFICGDIDSLTIRGDDVPGGLHFDNGKRMSHVKVVGAKKHSPSKEPLRLEEGEWTSIYIPIIPDDLTMDNGDVQLNNEDGLSEFFEDMLKIGKVSRIDFMSKPIPNSDRVAKCAYVHFDHWCDNHTAKLVRKTIDGKGEFSCNGYYDGFEFARFDKNRYINFKVNHKPIPAATADMNVHQLTARVKILEEQNAMLEDQNAELVRKHAWLEDQHAQLRADYSDVCIHRSNQIMSMMSREQKVKELESEIDDLKYMNGNAQVALDECKRRYDELKTIYHEAY
jgi:hypothetical protein